MPFTGNLELWAEQGILLLNSALTTLIGKSNVHKKIWGKYTKELITNISNLKSKCNKKSFYKIFFLWGNDAQKHIEWINIKCKILTWGHPSPLAQRYQKFIGCNHFTYAKKFLKKVKFDMDWNVEEQKNDVERKFNMFNGKTVAFTDGSCNPNKLCKEAIAGYSAVFSLGEFKDVLLYGNLANDVNFASNQRAEFWAIYAILKYLKTHVNEWIECVIVSDSGFWIDMFEKYMPKWARLNIDFTTKKNSDLTVPGWAIFAELCNDYDKVIEFRHIRSHNKDGWKECRKDSYEYFCWLNNDYADEYAKFARLNLKPGEHVISTVEY